MKILLVDDDPSILHMYQTAFSSNNYEVETANDGDEALTKATSFKPDIILLDIIMPNSCGLDVIANLKKDPALKDIPVIVLTNLSGDQEIKSVKDLGAVKVIIKSDFKPAQLVSLVQETVSSPDPS